jgi:type VI secretion system secreted protein Hcp
MKRTFAAALAVVAAVSFARPALAAVDGYMQFGDIKGESTDDRHKDWIEISSFNATGWRLGANGATRPAVNELTITKRHDVASPKLYEALHNGTHIPKVIIELTRSGGQTTYLLTDVVVSSYQMSSGGDRPEVMTLKFGQIQTGDRGQNPQPNRPPAPGERGLAPSSTHLPPPGGPN